MPMKVSQNIKAIGDSRGTYVCIYIYMCVYMLYIYVNIYIYAYNTGFAVKKNLYGSMYGIT